MELAEQKGKCDIQYVYSLLNVHGNCCGVVSSNHGRS